MPNLPFIFILLVFGYASCGIAQNTIEFIGKAGIGANHLSFESNTGKSSFGDVGIGVKYKLLQFNYTRQTNFHSLGQDTQLPYNLERTAIESATLEFNGINTVNHSARLRSHLFHLSITDPIRKNAFIGLGFGLHKAPKHWVFSERGGLPNKVLIPKYRFNSTLIKIGYHFDKFQFEFINIFNDDVLLPRSGMSASYHYSFYEKKLKKQEELTNKLESTAVHTKEFYSLFRVDIGYNHWQPLNYRNGGAIVLDFAMQVTLKKHVYIGANAVLGSAATGIDLEAKLTGARRVFNVDTSQNSFAYNRGASIYLGYDFSINYPKSYFVTLGYGHFWLDQVEYDPNFNPWIEPYFRAVQAQIGLKAGLFSNAIRLYIPTEKVKPFVEFRMSIGLDFFRLE